MSEKVLYTYKDHLGYRNELTDFLDEFLYHPVSGFYSYINDFDTKFLPLRFPGRTWGHIKIDKNSIITEIQIDILGYGMGSIYRPEAQQALQKYIGYKIEVEE